MNKYKVYYEIGGHQMRTTVEAPDQGIAAEMVRGKIKILKVEGVPAEPAPASFAEFLAEKLKARRAEFAGDPPKSFIEFLVQLKSCKTDEEAQSKIKAEKERAEAELEGLLKKLFTTLSSNGSGKSKLKKNAQRPNSKAC